MAHKSWCNTFRISLKCWHKLRLFFAINFVDDVHKFAPASHFLPQQWLWHNAWQPRRHMVHLHTPCHNYTAAPCRDFQEHQAPIMNSEVWADDGDDGGHLEDFARESVNRIHDRATVIWGGLSRKSSEFPNSDTSHQVHDGCLVGRFSTVTYFCCCSLLSGMWLSLLRRSTLVRHSSRGDEESFSNFFGDDTEKTKIIDDQPPSTRYLSLFSNTTSNYYTRVTIPYQRCARPSVWPTDWPAGWLTDTTRYWPRLTVDSSRKSQIVRKEERETVG